MLRKCKLLCVKKKLLEISIGICRFGMKATPQSLVSWAYSLSDPSGFLVKAGLGIDQNIFTKPLIELFQYLTELIARKQELFLYVN